MDNNEIIQLAILCQDYTEYMQMLISTGADKAILCQDYTEYMQMLIGTGADKEVKTKIKEKLERIKEQIKERKTELYLLKVIGDVEPELSGPFNTNKNRLKAAIGHRQNDPDKCDGIFKLDVINGKPQVEAYYGIDLDEESKATSQPIGRRLDETEYLTEDHQVSDEEQREIDRDALSDSSYDDDDFSIEEESRW
jgi:hypothetical protein